MHAAAGPASRAAVAGPAASFAFGFILLEQSSKRGTMFDATLELAHLLTVCTADSSLSSLSATGCALFGACAAQREEHAGALKTCQNPKWPSDEVSDFAVLECVRVISDMSCALCVG